MQKSPQNQMKQTNKKKQLRVLICIQYHALDCFCHFFFSFVFVFIPQGKKPGRVSTPCKSSKLHFYSLQIWFLIAKILLAYSSIE